MNAKVVIAGDVSRGIAVLGCLGLTGNGVVALIPGNISNDDDCSQTVRETLAQFGRLDVLINFVEADGMDKVTPIMKYATPEMIKVGRGTIINVFSVSGRLAIHSGALERI
jgi:NAD(P)-dependent dehydrogenase (short-subunit alcohol dehydrogenase family)